MTVPLPMAILPEPAPSILVDAVRAGGGCLVPAARAEGLVWLGERSADLAAVLDRLPSVLWVQLPAAGVEDYLPLVADGRDWTRAIGVYGAPVAEHALMLVLTCLRGATASVRSGRWTPRSPVTLVGTDVLIVGGGSIATSLLALLGPFGARATVLRRNPRPMPGARAVLSADHLDAALPAARVVVLAAPLTTATTGIIDAGRLALMRADACLVNVARGKLVVTADLVRALAGGQIAAAGLDVTDPEPLPAGHPLWTQPDCLITAHCAGTLSGSMAAFADLVAHNVRQRAGRRPVRGLVDPVAGY